jgi:hypothetical protein
MDLFNEINNPDAVIYILLFNACAQIGTTEALNITKKNSKDVSKSLCLNPRLSTSLLDALMKCDGLTYAESFFNASKNKIVYMYGAMMTEFNKENKPSKTIDLFNQTKINGIESLVNIIN